MDLLKFECNNLIIEGPFFMKKSKNSKIKRGVIKNQTPFFFKEPIYPKSGVKSHSFFVLSNILSKI